MAKILSVEVTLSQIRVAEIEQKGKKYKIYHAFRFAAPQGAVEDGYIRDTATVGELLKKELESRRIRTKKVCFAVSSSRVASRETRIPFVKESRIQDIIQANVKDYFPIDASKYVLSYTILDVEEGEEKQYHLMVYASPKSISAAYREVAEGAGLSLAALDYTGNSIYNAVRREYPGGVHLVMKIEERTTLITVMKDGALVLQRNLNHGIEGAVEAVRTYPVFGKELDYNEALEVLWTRKCVRNAIDMDPEESEPEDTDDFTREARREVTESLRYLVGNISRIIDYYISRNQDTEFDSIVCCGTGAEVLGLPGLLSRELGQNVATLEDLSDAEFAKTAEETDSAVYLAAVGSLASQANLMEKVTKKEKEKADNLRGAFLVFLVGTAAAVILAAAGVGVKLFQQKEQERFSRRIDEESSIETIYSTYNSVKSKYEGFQLMYQYTETPNEGLVAFIQEMEEKMPSNITVETFSSTGTEVSFSMRVTSKSEAANTLIQLRTFESLFGVTTTGISEAEDDGTVTMSVTCTYRDPALLDSAQ